MNTKHDNDLITMGMNLGVYTFAKLIAEGVTVSEKGWDILKNHLAEQLQKQTGMHPEDLEEGVQPVVEEMIRKVQS